MKPGERVEIAGKVLAIKPVCGTIIRDLGDQYRNGWHGRFYEVRIDSGLLIWTHTAKPENWRDAP